MEDMAKALTREELILLQPFLLQYYIVLQRSMRICTVTSPEDFADFFCSDAILVQNFCSNVSGEVSGKITSPEKMLLCLNSIKNLLRRLRQNLLYFALNRFLLQ
jgi:hypothetical protein